MAVDQENVTKILSALSHPIRRQILKYLSEKEECSFTDLMNALKIDTGKLSFHLKNLEAFLEQTPTNKYRLSKVGENAIVLIRDLEAWSVEAELAEKGTSLPLARFKERTIAFLIDFAIAFALFMAVPNVPSWITAKGIGAFLNVNIITFLILLWIYLTLLEGFAGQTLGKRLIGLETVATNGKKLLYDRAAVRNFGVAFLLPVDLLIGVRLKDKRYIRYFDKFSATTVIDLRGRGRNTVATNLREQAPANAIAGEHLIFPFPKREPELKKRVAESYQYERRALIRTKCWMQMMSQTLSNF
jgi:uncharacterized RDD family membrane protein YckC/DNA-binding transcriptional ArsR family regulator